MYTMRRAPYKSNINDINNTSRDKPHALLLFQLLLHMDLLFHLVDCGESIVTDYSMITLIFAYLEH